MTFPQINFDWIGQLPAWQQILAMTGTSFITEDGTLFGAIALVHKSLMAPSTAWIGNFAGIMAGDYILYGMGAVLRLWKNPWKPLARLKHRFEDVSHSTEAKYWRDGALLVSRVVPGTRLPMYLACGWSGYPLWRFTGLMMVSTIAWVTFALFAGTEALKLSSGSVILDLLVLIVVLVITRSILRTVLTLFSGEWPRKALLASFAKWRYFEFWPAILFYPPVLLYIGYLALKFRNIRYPLDSNPRIPNAGIIFESKWQIYRDIPEGPARIPTLFISAELSPPERFMLLQKFILENKITAPTVLKPDCGARGASVRIIRNSDSAREYFEKASYDIIAQEYCEWTGEAGLFYERRPDDSQGRLFSVTEKEFPFVTGDGCTRLGDLILKDPRARMIAGVYFERLKNQLDTIPAAGKKFALVECGNHCQGTIFKNGAALATPALLKVVDNISRALPDFYLGRFDVRFQDNEALKRGEFKIIEINASGSEATHIYDAGMSLCAAYGVLFNQWRIIFEIGHANYLAGRRSESTFFSFLKDCLAYRKLAKFYTISS